MEVGLEYTVGIRKIRKSFRRSISTKKALFNWQYATLEPPKRPIFEDISEDAATGSAGPAQGQCRG